MEIINDWNFFHFKKVTAITADIKTNSWFILQTAESSTSLHELLTKPKSETGPLHLWWSSVGRGSLGCRRWPAPLWVGRYPHRNRHHPSPTNRHRPGRRRRRPEKSERCTINCWVGVIWLIYLTIQKTEWWAHHLINFNHTGATLSPPARLSLRPQVVRRLITNRTSVFAAALPPGIWASQLFSYSSFNLDWTQ